MEDLRGKTHCLIPPDPSLEYTGLCHLHTRSMYSIRIKTILYSYRAHHAKSIIVACLNLDLVGRLRFLSLLYPPTSNVKANIRRFITYGVNPDGQVLWFQRELQLLGKFVF